MQFNREMIHTVRRIAKLAPDAVSPGLKLSNPDLLDNLRALYGVDENTETKSLIERFFELADQDISSANGKDAVSGKMYRGNVVVNENDNAASPTGKRTASKKKLTYRGRQFET